MFLIRTENFMLKILSHMKGDEIRLQYLERTNDTTMFASKFVYFQNYVNALLTVGVRVLSVAEFFDAIKSQFCILFFSENVSHETLPSV